MNLRDQLWKMLIFWCRTDICSNKFSAKVSLMLDNPFLVPSLCKLNHTSLCFIEVSTKSPARLLIPFRESNEVIPGIFKTARVSRLFFSCDYVINLVSVNDVKCSNAVVLEFMNEVDDITDITIFDFTVP